MKSLVSRLRPASMWKTLVLVNGLTFGCTGVDSHSSVPIPSTSTLSSIAELPSVPPPDNAHQAVSATTQPQPNPPSQVLPFHKSKELSADVLVEQVLARNLSLAQMA